MRCIFRDFSVLFLYSMFRKSSTAGSLKVSSHFCHLHGSMVWERLAQETGFGAGIHSEKHWGPKARIRNADTNQQLDTVLLCSLLFPHKNKYCEIPCFWKASSPNCQHTNNTLPKFQLYANCNRNEFGMSQDQYRRGLTPLQIKSSLTAYIPQQLRTFRFKTPASFHFFAISSN